MTRKKSKPQTKTTVSSNTTKVKKPVNGKSSVANSPKVLQPVINTSSPIEKVVSKDSMKERGVDTLNILTDFLSKSLVLKDKYDLLLKELSYYDQLVEDYLHIIEFYTNGYNDRAKVATQLKVYRDKRRVVKNEIELLQPLMSLMVSNDGKILFERLRKLSCQMSDINNRHNNATYRGRIIQIGDGKNINLKPPKKDGVPIDID